MKNNIQERINQTVSDIEVLSETLKERHSDNSTLVLRFDSVFRQLIGSLGAIQGNPIASESLNPGFNPKPITRVAGVKVKGEETDAEIMEKDVKNFVSNVTAVYDTVLGRDNHDLLTTENQEILRGVAKIAGMTDYETAEVNTEYLDAVKNAIMAKNKLETERAEAKAEIGAKDEKTAASEADTNGNHALSPAEKAEFKKKMVAEYTELFGKAPAENLSGPKLFELIQAKKEGK